MNRYSLDVSGLNVSPDGPYVCIEEIKIAPLKWHVPTDHPQDPDIEDHVLCAPGLGGMYSISKKQGVGPARLLCWAHDNYAWEGFNTIDECKAAAQDDLQKRVIEMLGI